MEGGGGERDTGGRGGTDRQRGETDRQRGETDRQRAEWGRGHQERVLTGIKEWGRQMIPVMYYIIIRGKDKQEENDTEEGRKRQDRKGAQKGRKLGSKNEKDKA